MNDGRGEAAIVLLVRTDHDGSEADFTLSK